MWLLSTLSDLWKESVMNCITRTKSVADIYVKELIVIVRLFCNLLVAKYLKK